jgi:hypothetical protein
MLKRRKHRRHRSGGFCSLEFVTSALLVRSFVHSDAADFVNMGGSGLVLVQGRLTGEAEVARCTSVFLRGSDFLLALFELRILSLTPTLEVCYVTSGIVSLTRKLILLFASDIHLRLLRPIWSAVRPSVSPKTISHIATWPQQPSYRTASIGQDSKEGMP